MDPDPVTLDGNLAQGRFGYAVADAGDLDADGYKGLYLH